MTLLTPNMFRRPEEPKIEDYNVTYKFDCSGNKAYVNSAFEKDHDQWKFITGPKPKFEWRFFNESTPQIGQEIYYSHPDNRSDEANWCEYYHNHECIKYGYDRWADKSTYDKTLKEWQDNQIRFPGWEFAAEIDDEWVFKKGEIYLHIYKNKEWIWMHDKNGFQYNGPNDLALFEKLLEIKER